MLDKRETQTGLFTADTQYLQFVGEESFYGFLARRGRELFRDEDFAKLSCADNGRTSVPPSLLALALLLQRHDRVPDEEAKARADFDLRWKVALGIGIDTRPFAKSTLQLFRAQLVIHEEAKTIFRRSLEYAKGLGRGAVEDTYNLIAEGIRLLSRAVAKAQGQEWEAWLGEHEWSRDAEPSIKGAAEVEWEDAACREAFLTGLIQDGARLLEVARHVRSQLEAESDAEGHLAQAAELLTQLLWQDVEPTERGYRIQKGTAKDRIPSAHDPEQRHGHKSHGKSFTGHKAAIAVDPESQLVTAAEMIAGNASDGESAARLVEASEANTGCEVAQVIGDTAYGSMEVRQSLGEREVIAPTVKPSTHLSITKADFGIDTEQDRVRCPMGHETRTWRWVWVKPGAGESKVRVKQFSFAEEVCRACPRYGECVTGKRRPGRQITLHPQEAQLQAARAFEQTGYFDEQYRQRVVVEHRMARLVGLGMRQARYCGRAKTRVSAYGGLAAAVANLTLLAGRGTAPARGAGGAGSPGVLAALRSATNGLTRVLRSLVGGAEVTRRFLFLSSADSVPLRPIVTGSVRTAGFRPDF